MATTAALDVLNLDNMNTHVDVYVDSNENNNENSNQCCSGAECCDGAPRLRLAANRAAELADMLKAIAHPVRLQMVDLLSRHAGDVCVCDIESQFDLKQPTISHHLKILRKAQIIDCQRQGSWLYYYIRAEAMGTLRSLLSEWTEQVSAQ